METRTQRVYSLLSGSRYSDGVAKDVILDHHHNGVDATTTIFTNTGMVDICEYIDTLRSPIYQSHIKQLRVHDGSCLTDMVSFALSSSSSMLRLTLATGHSLILDSNRKVRANGEFIAARSLIAGDVVRIHYGLDLYGSTVAIAGDIVGKSVACCHNLGKVPLPVRMGPREYTVDFLRQLFDKFIVFIRRKGRDGDMIGIAFKTTSLHLAHHVNMMLINVGVFSHLESHSLAVDGKADRVPTTSQVLTHFVVVTGMCFLQAFSSKIGLKSPEAICKLQAILEAASKAENLRPSFYHHVPYGKYTGCVFTRIVRINQTPASASCYDVITSHATSLLTNLLVTSSCL